jgi:hypothetical protein
VEWPISVCAPEKGKQTAISTPFDILAEIPGEESDRAGGTSFTFSRRKRFHFAYFSAGQRAQVLLRPVDRIVPRSWFFGGKGGQNGKYSQGRIRKRWQSKELGMRTFGK